MVLQGSIIRLSLVLPNLYAYTTFIGICLFGEGELGRDVVCLRHRLTTRRAPTSRFETHCDSRESQLRTQPCRNLPGQWLATENSFKIYMTFNLKPMMCVLVQLVEDSVHTITICRSYRRWFWYFILLFHVSFCSEAQVAHASGCRLATPVTTHK